MSGQTVPGLLAIMIITEGNYTVQRHLPNLANRFSLLVTILAILLLSRSIFLTSARSS